jgi:hypothetical protein
MVENNEIAPNVFEELRHLYSEIEPYPQPNSKDEEELGFRGLHSEVLPNETTTKTKKRKREHRLSIKSFDKRQRKEIEVRTVAIIAGAIVSSIIIINWALDCYYKSLLK